jgi:hypothetical protein
MPARRINKLASGIIDQLGGTTEFARWYGVDRRVAHWWRTYGFPAHSFRDLTERLQAEGIEPDPAAWHLARKSKKKPLARKPKPPAKASGARVSA